MTKEASRVLVPRSDRSPQLVPDLSYSAASWRRLASPSRVYYSNLRMSPRVKVKFFRASENAAHFSSVTASRRELPEYLLLVFQPPTKSRTHIHADSGSSLLTSLSLGFPFLILPFMLLPRQSLQNSKPGSLVACIPPYPSQTHPAWSDGRASASADPSPGG